MLRRSGLIHEQGGKKTRECGSACLWNEVFHQVWVWLEVESFWTGELAAFRDRVESSKLRRKGSVKTMKRASF